LKWIFYLQIECGLYLQRYMIYIIHK